MGEMADMALDDIAEWENVCDDYVAGNMSREDAYDLGIFDEVGDESMHLHAAYARAGAMDEEGLNQALYVAELEFDNASMRQTQIQIQQSNNTGKYAHLNKAAIANLRKEVPTCNFCVNPMKPRNGSFGKFYYCLCPEQRTVSDTYWQSIRIK